MEKLIEIGRALTEAMQARRGLESVDELYAERAESVEAVVPPNRDVRVASGREAIRAKREDWLKTHEIQSLDVEGPYVHPPNRFGVRFEAQVIQKAKGASMKLSEIAIYSVEDGKIVREEFFMMPK